ncbi:taste receptor type 2 member 39-like [Pleurodeles waltl]|uniref:taste receptor type 2 member 39-like n=1 Tax=Pleurodeles waltl TaxID=8319 RepID=UPI003709731D
MDPFQIIFLAFNSTALLIGITTNTCMAAVISTQSAVIRLLSTSNRLLLIAVALANILLQCCSAGCVLLRFLWKDVFFKDCVWKNFYILFPIFFFSNIWFNSWLCTFYCIKIVNFSHALLARIKLRFSGMVPWLLLGSVLASIVINVPDTVYISNLSTLSTTANTTFVVEDYQYNNFQIMLMIAMGCLAPLVVIVASSVLVLTSLYRHTQLMQQNMEGLNGGPNMAAHIKAAKTILSLLVLFIFYAVVSIVGLTQDAGDTIHAKFYITLCAYNSYPSINSLILILGNPKLKTAIIKGFSIQH